MKTAEDLGLDINTSYLGVTSSKCVIHDIPECFTTNDDAELRKGEVQILVRNLKRCADECFTGQVASIFPPDASLKISEDEPISFSKRYVFSFRDHS